MVRVLMSMRSAAGRNVRKTGFGRVSVIIAAVVGLVLAIGSLLVGFGSGPLAGRSAAAALICLAWFAGRLGFAIFGGTEPAVPIDLFRIVAVPRCRLAYGLFGLAASDATLLLPAVAFGSVIIVGFRHGPFAGVIGTIGICELLLITILVNLIASALASAGSRRRRDFGVVLAAGLVSVIVIMGPVLTQLLSLLLGGRLLGVRWVLDVLPTGWPAVATRLAAEGRVGPALAVLLGLAALAVVLAAGWPAVLAARLRGSANAGQHSHNGLRRGRAPSSPSRAVFARELRLWIRDPNRLAFLVLVFAVSLGACLIPLFSRRTTLLLPYVGLGAIVLGTAVAANGFGFDGPAFATSLQIPGSERAEIRGRQAAWLLIIGPFAVVASVVGLLINGQIAAWPWILGLLPALLGGGIGLTATAGVTAVQPLQDNGSPGPTWVIKTYATLFLTVLSALPSIAALIVGAATGNSALSWSAVLLGLVSGTASMILLTRYAERRLRATGPEIFATLASAPNGRR